MQWWVERSACDLASLFLRRTRVLSFAVWGEMWQFWDQTNRRPWKHLWRLNGLHEFFASYKPPFIAYYGCSHLLCLFVRSGVLQLLLGILCRDIWSCLLASRFWWQFWGFLYQCLKQRPFLLLEFAVIFFCLCRRNERWVEEVVWYLKMQWDDIAWLKCCRRQGPLIKVRSDNKVCKLGNHKCEIHLYSGTLICPCSCVLLTFI